MSGSPCLTFQAMTASRTTPTLWVLVIMIGPSRKPESSSQVVPVISPLPFIVNQPPKTASFDCLPRGRMAVTPVRTGPSPTLSFPLPEISVVWPTSTPLISVIALNIPGVPSNGTPRSRARGLVWDNAISRFVHESWREDWRTGRAAGCRIPRGIGTVFVANSAGKRLAARIGSLRLAGFGASLDAELLAGVGTQSIRGPGGSPDNVNCRIAHSWQLFDARFHLRADVDVLGASLCGEGHLHRYILLVFGNGVETHFVDEAEIHNIDGNLRVVALFQCAKDVFLS